MACSSCGKSITITPVSSAKNYPQSQRVWVTSDSPKPLEPQKKEDETVEKKEEPTEP